MPQPLEDSRRPFAMKLTNCYALLAVLSAVGPALAAVPLSSVPRVSSSNVVPGKFIIEVSEASEIPSKRGLESVHEAVYAELRRRRVAFTVNKQFNSAGLFTGAAVTLDNPSVCQCYDSSRSAR